MISEALVLRDALARVYRPWLLHLVDTRGWAVEPPLPEAIDQGEQWLSAALEQLLAKPFGEQRRGPLEVFQEAMRFPTGALGELGVDPVDRDEGAVQAIPGDIFDLAPASSSMLGDDVWRAHLAWGAAKAAAMRHL